MAETTPNRDAPVEPVSPSDESLVDANAEGPERTGTSGTAIIAWALASIALLTYVTLGSTPTYVWRFNRKYEESRSILRIWGVEANNLPRVSQQWVIDGAFYAALVLFLAGVVICLWFLVKAEPTGAGDQRYPMPDVGTTEG